MFLEIAILRIFREPIFQKFFIWSIFGGLYQFLAAKTIVLMVLICISLYIYLSFTFFILAKKLGYKKAWLALIPFANFFLPPILAFKNWNWGWFFLIPPLYLILSIFWLWKIYERRGYPLILSLFMIFWLIPIFGLGVIINLVIFGFVAFKDHPKIEIKRRRKND